MMPPGWWKVSGEEYKSRKLGVPFGPVPSQVDSAQFDSSRQKALHSSFSASSSSRTDFATSAYSHSIVPGGFEVMS